ncbi:hypothetical protein Syun_009293 [Stephania yunnanensis]|uniref:Uncharacterized protein n=1 Tax=Stephania yunnanensis TaxID=152371 RepID=A0AAP0PQI4_9MAGN
MAERGGRETADDGDGGFWRDSGEEKGNSDTAAPAGSACAGTDSDVAADGGRKWQQLADAD